MKLFFKHLLRSIRKRPLQPIIIALTMALSVLASVSAFTIKTSVADEISSASYASYGSADIVVQLNSSSKSRFMFDSEAEKILGDGAVCVGTYELAFSLEDETVFAKAVDFYKIDTVFDFSFTDYGELKENDVDKALMISEQFAKAHGVFVGEKIKLELFGKETEYKVCAISKSPYFDSYDVMVDIRGAMNALASESLFISALGDIKPYSTIYIDVINDSQIDEYIARLSASEMFGNKTVVEVSQVVNKGLVEITLPLIIDFCIILCGLLTAVVVFSCVFILSKQRTEENEAFICAGTRKKTLNLLQYLEIILYWLVGAPIGILLSFPALALEKIYLSLKYASHTVTLGNLLLGALLTLVISLLTVTLFVFSNGKPKGRLKHGRITLALLAILSLSTAVTVFSKQMARVGFGMFSALLVVIIVFFATLWIISKLLALLFDITRRRIKHGKTVKRVSLYYALKNLNNVAVLKNTSRLIATVVLIFLTVATIVGSVYGNLNATKEYFDGDYIVLNSTERCYDEIAKSKNALYVSRVYQSRASYENGYLTLITSSDNKESFGSNFEIEKLPQGNEAILSKTDARLLNVGIGDEFDVKLEGKTVTLTVKDIMDMGTAAIIIDSSHFGLSHNMLLVKAKQGGEAELLADLTVAASSELATVISAEELRSDKIESNTSLLKCANIVLITVLIYALLGIFNNLYESYRARREELGLYRTVGMSKSKLAKMIISELGSVFLLGAVIGLVGAIAAVLLVNTSLSPLNFEVIAYLKYLF